MNTWWAAQNTDEVYFICTENWAASGYDMPFSTAVDDYYWDFGNGYVPFFGVIGAGNLLMYGDNGYSEAQAMVPNAVASFSQITILEEIADQSMYLNETLDFDLANSFFNPSEEDMTITVSSSNTDAVTAELTGTALTISSLTVAGSSDITVNASAGDLSAEFTFTVEVSAETLTPPAQVEATDGGLITWGADVTEFRYDDGIATGQLGFGANPSSVLGGVHPYNAVINEVTWLLTSNAAHTEAVIYIFALDGAGVPDTAQLLHESTPQPNIDDAWNTYTLATPINAPNGFFVGICTPDIFTALGTDDGVGAPYEFQAGTQMGIADWTAGNEWLDVGDSNYLVNFTVRAMGQNLGEVRYTEEAPVADYSNTGLVYSALDTPIASVTRDFIEYKVYLDGVEQGTTTENEYQLTGLDEGTTYTAAVSAVYDDGESVLVGIDFTYTNNDGNNITVPVANALVGNYPNPFNPTTSIKFATVENGHVTLEIYNAKGQKVKTLVNETMSADNHTVDWNGTDDSNNAVSSGIYFYKMRTSSYNETKKMVLMK